MYLDKHNQIALTIDNINLRSSVVTVHAVVPCPLTVFKRSMRIFYVTNDEDKIEKKKEQKK